MLEAVKRDSLGRICRSDYGNTPNFIVFDDSGQLQGAEPPGLDEAIHLPPFEDEAPGGPREGLTVEIASGIHALHSIHHLLRRPDELGRRILEARSEIGSSNLLYIPHLATPHLIPILTYLGADLVDLYEISRRSLSGWRYTPYTLEAGDDIDASDNIGVAIEVMETVRSSIKGGFLRELTEATAGLSNLGVTLLRSSDRNHFGTFEQYASVHRQARVMARHATVHRPEVVRFRQRVIGRFKPPSYSNLVILPCSAVKPYSRSKSHRRFIDAIRRSGAGRAVAELMLTSPLGVVPRELEAYYPACCYDLPVTGHWSADEQRMIITTLTSYLEANQYGTIVAHLGEDMEFIREAFPDMVWSSEGRPGSVGSLDSLTSVLRGFDRRKPEGIGTERARSMVSFQFTSPDSLGEFIVKDRSMYDDEGAKIAKVSGRIVVTLNGGERLASSGHHTVEIDDFMPKGSVLAPGLISSTPDIRPGDEVAVVHDGEVRAVGQAVMGSMEMRTAERGVAVKVREHR